MMYWRRSRDWLTRSAVTDRQSAGRRRPISRVFCEKWEFLWPNLRFLVLGRFDFYLRRRQSLPSLGTRRLRRFRRLRTGPANLNPVVLVVQYDVRRCVANASAGFGLVLAVVHFQFR